MMAVQVSYLNYRQVMPGGAEMSEVVYVVDDDLMVLQSLQWLLRTVKLEAHIFNYSAEFLQGYSPGVAACIILDVRMPEINGMDLHLRIKSVDPDVPVIIVTGHADVKMAVRAMKEGAFDFIEKPYAEQQILERVQAAIQSRHPSTDREHNEKFFLSKFDNLTSREKQVLEQILKDHSNKLIAIELGISKKTVEFHRGNLMSKLGVTTVAELVRLSIKAGIDPEF